jgi:hypothetical protein
MNETTTETTGTMETGEAPALQREKLTKKAVTADHQVDRAVPCPPVGRTRPSASAMLNDL